MTAVTGKENTTSERVRPRQRPVRSDFLVFPKYVVTMDELAAGNINDVKIVHLADFLLKGDY